MARGTAITAMPLNSTILKRNLFVIYIAVINALVFNRSLFRKTAGLDLMTIGEVTMVSSLAMVNSSLVMNFVFVLRCHDIYSH